MTEPSLMLIDAEDQDDIDNGQKRGYYHVDKGPIGMTHGSQLWQKIDRSISTQTMVVLFVSVFFLAMALAIGLFVVRSRLSYELAAAAPPAGIVMVCSTKCTVDDIYKSEMFRELTTDSKLIIIDPELGGNYPDSTKMSNVDKTEEKELNLKLALRVKHHLKLHGYHHVQVNRLIANNVKQCHIAEMANARQAMLLISVFVTWSTSNTNEGVEVLYRKRDNTIYQTKHLADHVLGEIANQVNISRNEPIYQTEYQHMAMLSQTSMPTIRVSGGYMSNKNDLEKLRKDDYLDKIASGIASGVKKHYKSWNKKNRNFKHLLNEM